MALTTEEKKQLVADLDWATVIRTLDRDPNHCYHLGFETKDGCRNPDLFVHDTSPETEEEAFQREKVRSAATEVGAVSDLYSELLSNILGPLEESVRISQIDIAKSNTKTLDFLFESASKRSGDIDAHIDNVISVSNDAIAANLQTAIDATNTLSEAAAAQIPEAFDNIDLLTETASNAINTNVDNILGSVTELTDNAISGVGETLENISGFVSDGFSTVNDSVVNLVSNAGETFNDISNAINFTASQALGNVTDLTTGVSNLLSGNITDLIGLTDTTYRDYSTTLNTQLDETNNSTKNVIHTLQNTVKKFSDNIITDIGDTVGALVETASNLPKAISGLATSLAESAKINIADPLDVLALNLPAEVAKILRGATSKEENNFNDILTSLISPDKTPSPVVQQFINSILPDEGLNPVIKTIMFAIAAPMILMGSISGVSSVHAQQIMHEYSFDNPSQLLNIPDLVDALRRGNIDHDKFENDAKRLGFYPEDIATLEKLGRRLIPESEALNLWLRKLFTDDQLNEALTGAGYNATDSQALQDAAFYIPPIQDLITMGVREVFTPDIAEQFGLFEDYPEQLTEHAAKQGLSEEWAERYWAAHWTLPSPTMGFQMFHRQIIDEGQLSQLLRALDIMPAWRDNIIELSYSPLTRVDVRRMHKLGVLTDDEVITAYRDVGYSPENAERLKDFTVAYNEDPPVDDEVEFTELSRSMILNLYDDGVLDDTETKQMLIGLNYSERGAALLIYERDFNKDRKERKQAADNVINQFVNGAINYNQAMDSLNKSGLTTNEITAALNKLIAKRDAKISIPAKADLIKFFENKIIGEDEFREAMQLNGFGQKWTNAYISLINIG